MFNGHGRRPECKHREHSVRWSEWFANWFPVDDNVYTPSSSFSAISSPFPIGTVTANNWGWDFTRRR